MHTCIHACMHACTPRKQSFEIIWTPRQEIIVWDSFKKPGIHVLSQTILSWPWPGAEACIHACMHTCIHAYMHTCIHACMHTCTPRKESLEIHSENGPGCHNQLTCRPWGVPSPRYDRIGSRAILSAKESGSRDISDNTFSELSREQIVWDNFKKPGIH